MQRREFAGGSIVLPEGYKLREDKNWDTPAAIGTLENPKTRLNIGYSIFSYGNVFADPASLKVSNYKVIWSKTSGTGSSRKITTLAIDNVLKDQTLYISFSNGGPANFIATVTSKQEIAEVERVIATFEPKYPKRGSGTAQAQR